MGHRGHSNIFKIHDLVKHSKPRKPQPTLELSRFTADDKIWVASTLKDYIQRTKSLGGNEEQLLVSLFSLTTKSQTKRYLAGLELSWQIRVLTEPP